MQELIYFKGINGFYNHNIEILRDIAEVVGTGRMVNAYDNVSWAITEHGRIAIMITDRRTVEDKFRAVTVEFQGDGICVIYACDVYGKPIYDEESTGFDTHSYVCRRDGAHESFKKLLKDKYDVVY